MYIKESLSYLRKVLSLQDVHVLISITQIATNNITLQNILSLSIY